MNWLLIVVLGILGVNIWVGYRKGFLKVAYSLVSWIVVLAVVSWSSPHIESFIKENTSIYEKLQQSCEESLREEEMNAVNQTANGAVTNAVNSEENPLAELGIALPAAVVDNILEKTTSAANGLMEESGMYTIVAQSLADFILQGIVFFVALLAGGIVSGIIAKILGIFSKVPILSGVNRLCGLVAGGLHGLILVWVGFYIVALFGQGATDNIILSYIYESEFLKTLYENNLVVTVISYFL